MRVWCIVNIYLAVMKRPASSESAAEAIPNLIICEMVRMALLKHRTGQFSDRKMWASARLREFILLRYGELECSESIMSLEW